MILGTTSILQRCVGVNPRMISPFFIEKKIWDQGTGITLSYGLSYCGYDIRLRDAGRVTHDNFFLGSSLEYFNMPNDVVGVVHDKSTLARLGLAVQNTVIEPGWRGWLTLEISYHGHSHDYLLLAGQPIAQVIFHQIDQITNGYEGKYQDQSNEPVAAS